MNTQTIPSPHVVYCDGGLCNRLNEVIFALILRNKFGGNWEISWPKTNVCQAGLHSLFDINMQVCEYPIGHFLADSERYYLLTHETPGRLTPKHMTFHNQITDYESYQRIFETGRSVLYAHNIIPSIASLDDIALALRYIQIHPTIFAKAKEFCETHQINEKVIGLHIRKTDFGDRVDDNNLYDIASKSEYRFFVCSDDPQINDRFSILPNCTIFPKQSFPEKLLQNLNWGATYLDSDGESLIYNINRPRASVIEALIDLLILSRTNIVQTSGSTFLSMAIIFRSTNFFQYQTLL